MRYGLLLFAMVASAQQPDPRGFVNERLLRQIRPSQYALNRSAAPPVKQCAIPLLEAQVRADIDKHMVLPNLDVSMDSNMILPTIPVCGKTEPRP